MNGANLKDLSLIAPELILVGAALVLILSARRISLASAVTGSTVLCALAAAVVCITWLPDGTQTAFGGMITVDPYARFFKVLICCALALAALLSHRQLGAEHVRPAEYHALLLLASTGMLFAASASDLVTLYLGLELTTLCSYILVGITVDQILSAGLIRFRHPAVRYLADVWSDGPDGLCSHSPSSGLGQSGKQPDVAGRDRASGRGAGVQDCGVSVSRLGAGRIPGRQRAGRRVFGGRVKSGRSGGAGARLPGSV
jgi:hypothetical protein